ncbi:MAG: Uma2 family endonuclease [Pirellulaceae bacterium]|nr:Uma2 family endonuclease [Pirellulaceae bacterium]
MNAALTTSLAERIADLGGIAFERIRSVPQPGTATIEDLNRANAAHDVRCELVDNTLVEKAMGWRESLLAAVLLHWLKTHLDSNNVGVATGADGLTQLFPGVVRGPGVALVLWGTLPQGQLPEDAVPALVPDFVIEILCLGNTRAEMARKRREYFQAGVQLVWMVDPRSRTIAAYQTPEDVTVFAGRESISGGEVLPTWTFSVAALFAELDRTAPTEELQDGMSS